MVFTLDGLNEIRNWLAGDSATAPVAIAVGTGNTAVTSSDTALTAEIFRDTTSDTTAPFLVTYEMVMSSLDGTGNTIVEMGLVNNTAATTGTLFTHNLFAAIAKTSSIEVQFEQRLEVVE